MSDEGPHLKSCQNSWREVGFIVFLAPTEGTLEKLRKFFGHLHVHGGHSTTFFLEFGILITWILLSRHSANLVGCKLWDVCFTHRLYFKFQTTFKFTI